MASQVDALGRCDTDSPSKSDWNPVPNRVSIPLRGVELFDGPLKTCFDNNVGYLLSSYNVDDLLYYFRLRAGHRDPPSTRVKGSREMWVALLRASNAGRFLGGAGKALRFMEHQELQSRLNAVIAGIQECAESDGYILPYDPYRLLMHEIGNYDRSMFTHGMVEAGFSGNPAAFEMIRGFYDWLYRQTFLVKMSHLHHGYQGIIGFTRVHFTPLGKPQDIQTVLDFYGQDRWLEWLLRRDERAIWQHWSSHNYELTAFEAYLDVYRATGYVRYLEAVEWGREMFLTKWMNRGGIVAISEGRKYPPCSYLINACTQGGELCGSVFWAFLNQRFHAVRPDEEKYITEIEKVLYNPAMGNQQGDRGIRYHAHLHGRKSPVTMCNTCCEIQGSRLCGAIPEFIYSLADDGIYVNLFAASRISWKHNGRDVTMTMATEFPAGNDVSLRIQTADPIAAVIRVRVPSWASRQMAILVNGKNAGEGAPGTYLPLNRTWHNGDTIAFTLSAGLHVTRHAGLEQVRGHERFSIEYGPVLMAVKGGLNVTMATRALGRGDGVGTFKDEHVLIKHDPHQIGQWAKRGDDRHLHFAIGGCEESALVPYNEIDGDTFTCYPVFPTPQLRISPRGLSAADEVRELLLAAPVNYRNVVLCLDKNLGVQMAPIPAGSFVMGEEDWQDDTVPCRNVTIARPFLIGRHQVTQALWQTVMGTNPSEFVGADRPVQCVNWFDCIEFCGKLTSMFRSTELVFRLPTEAEWEYASRAGLNHTRYGVGDGSNSDLGDVAHYYSDSLDGPQPVGGKFPNGWGLYDMLGNVLEWTSDWYDRDYYGKAPDTDPLGPKTGRLKVVRGGSWLLWRPDTHCASRNAFDPNWRNSAVGLRIVVSSSLPDNRQST